MKQNYDEYHFTKREILKYLSQSFFLCGMVNYLFYKNVWVFLLMISLPVFYMKWKKKQLMRERRKKLNYQFKDALNALSVAVQAGYSIENAVSACTRDVGRILRTFKIKKNVEVTDNGKIII